LRLLVLSTNSPLAAAVRYRALQYFPYLTRAGFACEHRGLFDERLEQVIYRPGHGREKITRALAGTARRLRDVLAGSRYDLALMLREAFLVGPPLLEALIALRRPLIFDLDDAVWEPYDSPSYGRVARWLKCAWKTGPTIRMAKLVIAGNPYIASYMRARHGKVALVPTVVDTDVYRPADGPHTGPPVIGWIGSHSTAPYLAKVVPALERLARERRFRLRLVGARNDLRPAGVEVENLPWRLDREVADVRSFDIGLFPVPDDRWSRGKSGFKAVQYGAVGIPTVASPVTVNREIVIDGVTGLHADSSDDWHGALKRLLDDPSARARMGAAARERILARYSLAAHGPRLVAALQAAASGAAPPADL
jgi:glycosyltransferase involved in cell wall biosynthesis